MRNNLELRCFRPVGCTAIFSDDGSAVTIESLNGEAGKLILEGTPGKLGNINWNDYKYLVFDAINHGDHSMAVEIEFWDADHAYDDPNIHCINGILPKLKTRIAFPLDSLKGQNLFLPRTPGKLKTVVHGSKVELNETNRFAIGTAKFTYKQVLEISNLHLSDTEPNYPLEDKKLVDEMGQWMLNDWPEKARSVDEMVSYLKGELHKTEKNQGTPTFKNRDEYGGWKGKKFDATGYFRTQHDGRRWWLVDPDGYAFYSMGMDVTSPGESGLVTGIEKLFGWLPDKSGEFKDAYSIEGNSGNNLFINFGVSNLIRAFGPDKWWQSWAKITRERMSDWGFNTIGNWSPMRFIKYSKLPYVWPLGEFPTTAKNIFRDFPDVFSDEYKNNSSKFAEQIKAFEGDPYMIGYFLRNEPEWAFVNNLNIAEELLENEADLYSKNALIDFLSKRYSGSINKFNKAWNTSFSGFNQLKKKIRKASKLSDAAAHDLKDFSKKMIELYVKIPSQAVKMLDPYHLNLGMRYAFISSDDLFAGYENFDVFSLNNYKMSPVESIEKVGKFTNLPVMIGEYHFGALDRGPTATGLRAVTSQDERGKAFRYYNEAAAATEYCVGTHYFILNDQAALGRFDGENYQIGFTDVCHKPYGEMVRHVVDCNKVIYDVADGKKEKYNISPDEIYTISY